MLCSFCFSGEDYEEFAVTIHAVMMTVDGSGFVWVTDRLAAIGGGFGMVEKITYLKNDGIACSIWGDHIAMHMRDAFITKLRSGSISLADRGELKISLTNLAEEVIRNHKGDPASPLEQARRGMLLAVLDKEPTFYSISIGWPVTVMPITTQATFGDGSNPALFFTQYYYERSDKTVPELLTIGVHTVRMAEEMNSKGIRGVDAWVYESGELRQLTKDELMHYALRSDIIDSQIMAKINSL